MCDIISFKQKPESEFDKVTGERRENLLMETAMRFQEIFDDMFYGRLLDFREVMDGSEIERLQTFRDWAREFEEKYYGTDEYENDYLEFSEDYIIGKILGEYGNEKDRTICK